MGNLLYTNRIEKYYVICQSRYPLICSSLLKSRLQKCFSFHTLMLSLQIFPMQIAFQFIVRHWRDVSTSKDYFLGHQLCVQVSLSKTFSTEVGPSNCSVKNTIGRFGNIFQRYNLICVFNNNNQALFIVTNLLII